MRLKGFSLALVLCASGASAQEVLSLQPKLPDGETRFARQWYAPGQKPVALALRGGSAKALAHIGVLQRFEEEGIPVGGIAGTSGGAAMAGFMGAGYSPRAIQDLLKVMNMGAPLDDRLRSPGRTLSEDETRNSSLFEMDIFKGQLDILPGEERSRRVFQMLWKVMGRSYFEFGDEFDNFRVPVRIVASDLQTGDAWVFSNGHLPIAVLASMSIPGLLAPVEIQGHQLVDGGMVENLPTAAARKAFPGMLHVGVDIGRTWNTERVSDVGSLLGRVLDVSMRQTELAYLKLPDLLLRPDTSSANDFDFQLQVDKLVGMGRKSFDAELPALEALLYGPEGAVPVARTLRIEGAVPEGLEGIRKACLPSEGPLRRSDLLRLLRHIHTILPVRTAAITLPPTEAGEAVLRLELQPAIRQVELDLAPNFPAPYVENFRKLADRPGLREGQPFSDVALDDLIRQAALDEILTSFQGTAFDPGTGVLRLKARPILLKAVEFPKESRLQAIAPQRLTARLFAPLVGAPIRTQEVIKRLEVLKSQFGVVNPVKKVDVTPDGVILHADPEILRGFTIAPQLAYETTWGGHIGVDAKLRGAIGLGSALRFQGAYNSLQKSSLLSLGRGSASLLGTGVEIYGFSFSQDFGSKISLPNAPALAPTTSNLRYRGGGFGFWGRFGKEDKALARIDVEQRKSDNDLYGTPVPPLTDQAAQASLEMDSLNYQLLATSGSVLRLRGGASFHTEDTQKPFQFAYGQYRHLFPVPSLGMSVDLGAELGLGWNTPADRWNILGGSNSIIGSRSAAYLFPNFGILSMSLPFTSISVLGIGFQVVPRVDWARLAATPTQLSSSARVLGTGLVLRAIVRSFYLELAYGQTQTRGLNTNGTQKNTEISFLIGARPFDLWKHH